MGHETTAQYSVSLHRQSDGMDAGEWRTASGGGVESSEVFTRDEYGQGRKQLGSMSWRDPFTASRGFYPETDNLLRPIMELDAGHTVYVATIQTLDPEGFTVGAPRTLVCMLKSIKPADIDVSNESAEGDTYTVELSPEGGVQV